MLIIRTVFYEELPVAQCDREQAEYEAAKQGPLHGSIMNGERDKWGLCGEILLARRFEATRVSHRSEDFYHYDMTKNDWRIDAKSKCVNSVPRPEYECTVFSWNTTQQCDYYVFLRIMKDFSRAWLLGCMERDEYYRKAYFSPKGQVDPNLVHKADGWNLRIDQLHSINRILTPKFYRGWSALGPLIKSKKICPPRES